MLLASTSASLVSLSNVSIISIPPYSPWDLQSAREIIFSKVFYVLPYQLLSQDVPIFDSIFWSDQKKGKGKRKYLAPKIPLLFTLYSWQLQVM